MPLCLGLLLASAPAAAAERSYFVTDFDRIQVDGPFEVSLVTGHASGARAIGSSDALERVIVEVQGHTLRIHSNPSAWGGYPGRAAGTVRIEASTRELRAAAVIGSGRLDIDGARGLRVDLSLSGSGRLTAEAVDADNLIVGLLGSGRLTLAGQAKQLRATIQGSGDLAAESLRADDASILADTAGTVAVQVIRAAKVTAAGAGDVTVLGTRDCTIDARGSGRVSCGTPR
ncbi:MAG TPA: head GIN domain-containing protein [Allosphingosinicella sp.]